MEVTCLSVPNPRSYLLCYGIADVENRGFPTDYRGPLYIHSTGRFGLAGMPDMAGFPVPVLHEFDRMMAAVYELEQKTHYLSIPEHGVRVTLKSEDRQPENAVAQYSLLADVYAAYRRDPGKPFFHVKAVIGRVDLVDVVTNSKSSWAESGYHHWILENPVVFAEPRTGIPGSRTGLWTCDLPD